MRTAIWNAISAIAIPFIVAFISPVFTEFWKKRSERAATKPITNGSNHFLNWLTGPVGRFLSGLLSFGVGFGVPIFFLCRELSRRGAVSRIDIFLISLYTCVICARLAFDGATWLTFRISGMLLDADREAISILRVQNEQMRQMISREQAALAAKAEIDPPAIIPVKQPSPVRRKKAE